MNEPTGWKHDSYHVCLRKQNREVKLVTSADYYNTALRLHNRLV